MANILLAWQNRIDEATVLGGSWSASLPLANIQNRQVQKVARSSGVTNAATQFVIDLGQARAVGVLALVVHNVSVSGRVRVTASDSAGFSTLYYDSGFVNVWPTGQIPQALLEWEEDNFWLGTISSSARAGYQSPFVHILPNPVNMRYWKVEIDDTTNADGFVQIGRVFIARGWRPAVNYSYGAELGFEDPTPIETSLSGAEFFDVRSKFRVFSFRLNFLPTAEAYGQALDLQRVAGVSGEVLLVPDSDDLGNMPARSFVGRLRNMRPISQPKPAGFDVQFEIKELL